MLKREFIGVSITPGQIQLTVTLPPVSFASERVKPVSADLVMEYALSIAAPATPHTEDMKIILPNSRASIFSSESAASLYAERTFTEYSLSRSDSVVSSASL